MQVHRQRLDRRPERRAPLQTLRCLRRHPPPATRAVATPQRDPRHVRPHRRQLDPLVHRLRRLLLPGQLRPAVRATLRAGLDHAVRVRMQLAPHSRTPLALALAAPDRLVRLLAPRGRQRRILRSLGGRTQARLQFRDLRRQLRDLRCQLRVRRSQCNDEGDLGGVGQGNQDLEVVHPHPLCNISRITCFSLSVRKCRTSPIDQFVWPLGEQLPLKRFD